MFQRTSFVLVLVLVPLLVVADDSRKKPETRSQKPAPSKSGGTNTSSGTKSASNTKSDSSKPARSLPKTANKRAKSVKRTIKLAPEEEAAATAFVTKHHNDLLELLIHLKEDLPQEYNKAIRDLSRTSDRLESWASRDKTRYQLELRLWQAKSKRQLLSARLQMSQGDEKLIQQLRKTLTEEQRLQLSVYKNERDRIAARLKRLEEQIAKQEKTLESAVDRQLATLTKSSQRKVKTTKRKTPASKPNTTNVRKPGQRRPSDKNPSDKKDPA